MKIFIFILISISVVSIDSKSDNFVQRLYNSLNREEQCSFGSYFLDKGYFKFVDGGLEERNFPYYLPIKRTVLRKLENLPIPESFPEAFVIRVMETYNLTLQEIHRLSVFGQICLPNGECIDPCDAGNICCT